MHTLQEYREQSKNVLKNTYLRQLEREKHHFQGSGISKIDTFEERPLIKFASFGHEVCDDEAMERTIAEMCSKRRNSD